MVSDKNILWLHNSNCSVFSDMSRVHEVSKDILKGLFYMLSHFDALWETTNKNGCWVRLTSYS